MSNKENQNILEMVKNLETKKKTKYEVIHTKKVIINGIEVEVKIYSSKELSQKENEVNCRFKKQKMVKGQSNGRSSGWDYCIPKEKVG